MSLIAPLNLSDLAAFQEHFQRHKAESGQDGDIVFMPFEPGGIEGPQGLNTEELEYELTTPGWQRWWALRDETGQHIVGHVDLKGSRLSAMLHRCELGIGIERGHRHNGHGRALMQAAIDFCRAAPSLDYLDLRVFSHNHTARRLYQSLGFREVAVMPDLMRIQGESIDDVFMTLNVAE